MISELQAGILGAIQGLTEFLPVSSSAHLVLVPWLLRWRDSSLAFDVALHLGTLLALLIYYWRDWLNMAVAAFRGDRKSLRLLGLLVVASVPGAIIGLLFEKQAETVFRSPMLISISMAALGLLLWVSDVEGEQSRTMGDIRLRDVVLIGLSQAFAIVPGVSRSGATITMARFIGVERQDAANFSFLMATPIIAGAGLLEAPKILHEQMGPAVVVGFAAAAVFGLLAIAGLIRLVKTRTYQPFAWYRLALAFFVIVTIWSRA
jgi:undecaprenyl-diphosphatase